MATSAGKSTGRVVKGKAGTASANAAKGGKVSGSSKNQAGKLVPKTPTVQSGGGNSRMRATNTGKQRSLRAGRK